MSDKPDVKSEMYQRGRDGTRRFQTFYMWEKIIDRCGHDISMETPCPSCKILHARMARAVGEK